MRLSFRGRDTTFLALIQGAIAYEWLKAGIEKATDPAFIPGMGKTVAAFASTNPNDGFAGFLTGTVAPHATGFGYLVMYGEILTGLAFALGAVVLLLELTPAVPLVYRGGLAVSALAAVSGATMSFCFWQAAGWTSVSTDGLNVLMGLVEIVLGASAIAMLVAHRSRHLVAEPILVKGTPALKEAALHR